VWQRTLLQRISLFSSPFWSILSPFQMTASSFHRFSFSPPNSWAMISSAASFTAPQQLFSVNIHLFHLEKALFQFIVQRNIYLVRTRSFNFLVQFFRSLSATLLHCNQIKQFSFFVIFQKVFFLRITFFSFIEILRHKVNLLIKMKTKKKFRFLKENQAIFNYNF
jgi:hypothetical protein